MISQLTAQEQPNLDSQPRTPERPSQVPHSTYRLQLGSDLGFTDAKSLIQYLSDLGIGAVYLSPFFRARAGSTHGYDVVDHSQLDPELGSEQDVSHLAEALQQHGMGLLMDLVPNHMGVDDPHNQWWQDVLENGRASIYAKYFDIDWDPPKEALRGKVLLAVLGDQFGKVLEDQQLTLDYDDQRFVVRYYERHFPTDPRTWVGILKQAVDVTNDSMPAESVERTELESITTSLEHLPPRGELDADAIIERNREKEVARRRLFTLIENCEPIRRAVDQILVDYNGRRGEPASFDKLEALLADQPYRLCYWRVATDEINYRRFFDVDALAAIRVEDPEVFAAVHQKALEFIERGWVTGLRIDHADGLLDPQQYLTNLAKVAQSARSHAEGATGSVAAPFYMLVEKILAPDESLPLDWPIQGTTGYDFLNQLNGLFVDRRGAYALRDVYQRFVGAPQSFSQVLYESKRTILATSLSSELYMLSQHLDHISEQHRWSRDFTRLSLYRALREVVASFPVYRTYIRPNTVEVRDEDRRRIQAAVRIAKRRNPAMSASFFDFIAAVLLLEDPEGLSEANRQERRAFVLKLQQVTGPVTAKGLEDTAFYRYYPLASLNEVGGDPTIPGTTIEQFHRWLQDRCQRWPYDLSTTGTHDTKRGEGVRARLNVLSEIPEEWEEVIRRWKAMNAPASVELDGAIVPDGNEEYLIYQTLIGTWPLGQFDAQDRQAYIERIARYLDKALREAKLHTSWLNPNEEYDQAVARFVRTILGDTQSSFVHDLDAFTRRIADAGFVNSLAQTLIKICAPGVPDFYQGTEFWDFNLVDPDNRRPVDFAARRQALSTLIERARIDLSGLVSELLNHWPDERITLFVVWRALEHRRQHAGVFAGSYRPLSAEGPRKANLFAFSRETNGRSTICLVPRLAYGSWPTRQSDELATDDEPKRGWPRADWWQDTLLALPDDSPSHWRHVLTGHRLEATVQADGSRTLDVRNVLRCFPVALLAGER